MEGMRLRVVSLFVLCEGGVGMWGIKEWTMDGWVGGSVLWDERGTMDEV